MTGEEGGQSIPLTHIAQLRTLQQYTRQPHTTCTHGGEEGRSNTPTSWCHCVGTSQIISEFNQFKKQKHTCKKVMDTLPNLKHNKQSSPTTQTATWKGGLVSSTLRGCLCGTCGRPLTHPSHP